MFFFFQAEDGIRDIGVTGVQTCALPICVTVAGGGFLLNNEMDDFAAEPGKPNVFGLVQGETHAIPPGKQIGRASCRGREYMSVVAASLKNNNIKISSMTTSISWSNE